ncbi:MAG: hypothetical protein K2Q18_10340 [Bdellovibrionales bacterium]|nr:hypothetical protein [Bdellovibrionales bacterium]
MRIPFVFLFFSLNLMASDFSKVDVEAVTQKNSCHQEIEHLINEWGSLPKDKWRAVLSSNDKFIYVKPTSKFAVWIEFQEMGEGIELSKVTPGNITAVKFDKKCQRSFNIMSAKKVISKVPNVVDDQALFGMISKHATGLIFSWSPHMGLSLKGLKIIQQLALGLKLPLIVLMDAQASSEVEFAKKRLEDENIQIGKILIGSSMDLFYRRTHIHYPNLIVFKDGRIVEGMLPGLANENQALDFIKDQLK